MGCPMKMSHVVAAVILMGLAAPIGSGRELRFKRSITAGNRLHTGRAPRGSIEAAERIAAAEAKRTRKLRRNTP